MTLMVSVDPGVDYYARWEWDQGKLVAGALVKSPHMHSSIDVLVVEVPEIRTLQTQKGRQKDIINLAVSVGVLIGTVKPKTLIKWTPSQWSKGKKKGPRHRAALECLSKAELAIHNKIMQDISKTYYEDMFDALALGAWTLKRVTW